MAGWNWRFERCCGAAVGGDMSAARGAVVMLMLMLQANMQYAR